MSAPKEPAYDEHISPLMTALEDVVSMEALAQLLCQGVYNVLRACVVGECCDPMERMVDGLTVRECLERYVAWQHNRDEGRGGTTIYWVDGVRHVRPWTLDTHAQVQAAQSAWSAQLRAKQQAERERERCAVVYQGEDE